MDLRDYLRVLRRRWAWVLLFTIAGGAIGYGITTQITPQYQSTSSVFISTRPQNADDAAATSDFSQQRVASYADIAGGLELAQQVVDSLDLDVTAEQLTKQVQATAVTDTVLLRIQVTYPDPERAQQINAALLEGLADFVDRLETPPGSVVPLLSVNVVDTPSLPDSMASPSIPLNVALALGIGLLVGVGIATGRELTDTRVRRLEDVPALADTPVLATLPWERSVASKPLITDLSTQAPRVESFRVLGVNLSFLDVDKQCPTLVISSSTPSEGKTTIAVNAALSLASSGYRTLLVDADLRRPNVAGLLGLEQAVGLSTALSRRNVPIEDCIQYHAPSGLDVLTAGRLPPNPFELLQSKAMAHLLEGLRERYDMVILDAPPLLPVADSALLASITDGVVFVVREGVTTREQVAQSVRRLQSVAAPPLGVVLNMVRRGHEKKNMTYGYAAEPDATLGIAESPSR